MDTSQIIGWIIILVWFLGGVWGLWMRPPR